MIYQATRNLLLDGIEYLAGDVVNVAGLTRHRLKQLLAGKRLVKIRESLTVLARPTPESNPAVDPILDEVTDEPLPVRVRKRRGAKA